VLDMPESQFTISQTSNRDTYTSHVILLESEIKVLMIGKNVAERRIQGVGVKIRLETS
jgi:hypothetical protein